MKSTYQILILPFLLSLQGSFIEVQAQQCEDLAGFLTSDGADCAWFAEPVVVGDDDVYYYDDQKGQTRCEAFGSCCMNGDGHTAATACCACGGGTYYSQCTDFILDGGLPWTDSHGDGCAFYAEATGDDGNYYDDFDTKCDYYGSEYRNVYTAQEACCVCGGGYRGSTSGSSDTSTTSSGSSDTTSKASSGSSDTTSKVSSGSSDTSKVSSGSSDTSKVSSGKSKASSGSSDTTSKVSSGSSDTSKVSSGSSDTSKVSSGKSDTSKTSTGSSDTSKTSTGSSGSTRKSGSLRSTSSSTSSSSSSADTLSHEHALNDFV